MLAPSVMVFATRRRRRGERHCLCSRFRADACAMPKRNTLSLALQSRQIFRRRRLLAFFMSLLTTLKVPLRRQNKSAREKHPLRFGRESARACVRCCAWYGNEWWNCARGKIIRSLMKNDTITARPFVRSLVFYSDLSSSSSAGAGG